MWPFVSGLLFGLAARLLSDAFISVIFIISLNIYSRSHELQFGNEALQINSFAMESAKVLKFLAMQTKDKELKKKRIQLHCPG